MNKMRFSLLVAGVASLCNVAQAQSVDQGKQFLYYHRYKSASDVFDKILASNPNNIDAIYWKGQTLLDLKDSVGAQDLYSKALQTNGNAPLLLAGMGGVELRFGKTADAKQRFETAVSLSKAKDINVLNAVADNNVDAPAGDAQYAIEKLTQATQIKNFHDADTYLLMGDAYRKLVDGGNAVQSYQKALTVDPKLAEAKYKIGRIYLTQNNKEFFLPAFEDAVQMDPLYAPAYYELFYYYYFHWDKNKATDALNKYIANSDPGPDVDVIKIDFKVASGDFQGAKADASALVAAQGDKATPRLYKLIAYTGDTLGDNACGTQNIATYFQKQDKASIIPADYIERASIEGHSTDSNVMRTATADYMAAIQMDTVAENRAKYLSLGMAFVKKIKDKQGAATLAALDYQSKKNPTNTDLYNWGFANYSAGNYKTAYSIFCGIYETKYPDEIFGYLWCKNSKVAQDDSVGSQGLAVEAYQKLADFCRAKDSIAKAAGSADSIKLKRYIIESYGQLAGYYNNIKKDKENALVYLRKILEVDPTNTDAAKFIEILTRPPKQPARSATGTKPRSTGK